MESQESEIIVIDEGIEESSETLSGCCSSGVKKLATTK
jgi:putative radical SAM-modified peptide